MALELSRSVQAQVEAGDSVDVLVVDAALGMSHVRTTAGEEGWMRNRHLQGLGNATAAPLSEHDTAREIVDAFAQQQPRPPQSSSPSLPQSTNLKEQVLAKLARARRVRAAAESAARTS